MLNHMSAKILQQQGKDKATSCHTVCVRQELMLIARVNINTTSVCHYHGIVHTVGDEEQATEVTAGSHV